MKVYKIFFILLLFLLSVSIIKAEHKMITYKEEIIENNKIDIIIEFKQENLYEYKKEVKQSFIGNIKINNHKNNINKEHKRFKENLNKIIGKEVKYTQKYKTYMNGLAFKIDKNKIEEIKEMDNIKNVWIDELLYPDMNDVITLTDAENLWKTIGPNGSNITGKGITIAIIDTGIQYDHPDLGNCTTAEFLAGTCDKVLYGYDFLDYDNDPYDLSGHGTHVAGIVGANGTFKGMAPDAQFLSYRVCSEGCPTSAILAAIENATSYGVDIITMSLGSSSLISTVYDTVFENAISEGIIITVSAGNNYNDYTIGFPGSHPLVLGVGSLQKDDLMSAFSSRGLARYVNGTFSPVIKPNIVSYGSNINSTCITSTYCIKSGTSMSTPVVAGIAALIKQKNPNWTGNTISNVISNTATDVGHRIIDQGSGKVNLTKAINASSVFTPQNRFIGLRYNSSIENWNKTIQFNITRLETGSVIYSIIHETNNSGLTGILTGNTFTLTTINETQYFNLTIISDLSNTHGLYEGFLKINSSINENFSIPYAIYIINNSLDCPNIVNTITTSTIMPYTNNCTLPCVSSTKIFEITTGDITLDCNNSIYRGLDAVGCAGIYSIGNDNVTIKNCGLENYYYGIYSLVGNNSNFSNNTLIDNNFGINIHTMENSNIQNNSFSENNVGALIMLSEKTNFNNNAFNDENFCTYIYLGNKNRIYNNSFNGSNRGVYVRETNYNNITGNNFNELITYSTRLFISNYNIYMNNTYSDDLYPVIQTNDFEGYNSTYNQFYNEIYHGPIEQDMNRTAIHLINATHNETNGGQIYIYNYAIVNVTYNQEAQENVNISVYNNITGSFIFFDSDKTNILGYTKSFNGLQKKINDTNTYNNTIKFNVTSATEDTYNLTFNLQELTYIPLNYNSNITPPITNQLVRINTGSTIYITENGIMRLTI